MSDWQKGDLALCVKDSAGGRAKAGCVYTVSGVFSASKRVTGTSIIYEGLGLLFAEIAPARSSVGFRATLFRKITPGAKIEGIEEPRRLPVKERADA